MLRIVGIIQNSNSIILQFSKMVLVSKKSYVNKQHHCLKAWFTSGQGQDFTVGVKTLAFFKPIYFVEVR